MESALFATRGIGACCCHWRSLHLGFRRLPFALLRFWLPESARPSVQVERRTAETLQTLQTQLGLGRTIIPPFKPASLLLLLSSVEDGALEECRGSVLVAEFATCRMQIRR